MPASQPDPEELEKQIRQVEAHLAWLKSLRPDPAKPDAAPPAATPTGEPDRSPEPQSARAPTPPPPATPATGEDRDPDAELITDFVSHDQTDIEQLRKGCLIFSLLLIGSVVFFFFGLPYLIK